jgi:hypothetical protein
MAAEAMAWAAMRCARTRGDLVARFARQGTEWQLAELTPVEESVDSGEARLHISGSFGLAPGYEGCPGCQARGFVECIKCGSLSCWPQTSEYTCGWCGNQGPVSGQIEAIEIVDGG